MAVSEISMETGFKGYDFERAVLDLEQKILELEDMARSGSVNGLADELLGLKKHCESVKRDVYGKLTPWQKVQIARHPRRPYTLDYIERIFSDFVELRGDRLFAEDKAVVGGIARLDARPVVVIGHQKGRGVQESMARNFGMPHPEGYRKALRLMKLAARFHMPVITFIDTAGAYPGIGAEERGQATAIAENLRDMAVLPVPVICCVIGEGGSGGALAIGVGDRLLMLENAWYSVISPEGCASILYRDAAKAEDAATALKLTAADLQALGVVDEIVPEPLGGAHRDVNLVAGALKDAFERHLKILDGKTSESLVEERYQKIRAVGSLQSEQKKTVKSGARKRSRA